MKVGMVSLIQSGDLSQFDFSFLSNWLVKKSQGNLCHADEQARALAVLYSNKLGEITYSQIAPMLALPSARQARRIRAKDCREHPYLPGLNDWVFKEAGGREVRPLQNGMDGTRVIRAIELYISSFWEGNIQLMSGFSLLWLSCHR